MSSRSKFHWTTERESRMTVAVTAGLVALLGLVGGCKLEDPTATSAEDLFTVQADASEVEADGVSRTPVTVVLDDALSASAEVRLRVDNGRFAEAGAQTPREITLRASQRQARATYVSDTRAGSAIITAEIGGFVRSDTVKLVAAPPAVVQLTTDRTRAVANGEQRVTLTATLLRPENAGIVTLGSRVTFEVRDSTGALIPHQTAIVAVEDAKGTVTHGITSQVAQPVVVTAVYRTGGREIRSEPVRITFLPVPASRSPTSAR